MKKKLSIETGFPTKNSSDGSASSSYSSLQKELQQDEMAGINKLLEKSFKKYQEKMNAL